MNKKMQIYCENFAETIVNEVTTLVETERKEYGSTFIDGANIMILGSLIGTMLYNKLHEIASSDDNDVTGTLNDQKVLDFQKYKMLIQDAISSGFEHGIKAYMNEDVTYRTEISAIKEQSSMLN